MSSEPQSDRPQVTDPPADRADAPLADRVAEVLERIRPAIQMDGGDIRFVEVSDDGVVAVELQGACVGCPSSTMTLKMGVQRYLQSRIPEVTDVVAI